MRPESRAKKAVVVANGTLADPDVFSGLLAGADMVVAADGGARVLLRNGLRADLVLGDFDSLEGDLLQQWRAGGGSTLAFPAEKDETDLELALGYVTRRGASRVAILGALGGRLDHEMANVLLLAAPVLAGISAEILDVHTRAIVVRHAASLDGEPGDLLSLLPISSEAADVSTEGLKYRLQGDTLGLGPSRGVSNVFSARQVRVQVGSGVLLAIHRWPEKRPFTW